MDQGAIIKFSLAITAILVITGILLLKSDPSQSETKVKLVQEAAQFLEQKPFQQQLEKNRDQAAEKSFFSSFLSPKAPPPQNETAAPLPTPAEDGFFHEHDAFVARVNEDLRNLENHPDPEKIDELLKKIKPLFRKTPNMSEADRSQIEQWQATLDQILEPYTKVNER